MADLSFVCVVGKGKTARKDTVEFEGGELPKIKLRSPRSVPVGTQVSLRSGRQQAQGIVDKCSTSDHRALMTVQIQRGGQWLVDLIPAIGGGYDPGVHSVNEFITDDAFLQLMNELDSKNHTARL